MAWAWAGSRGNSGVGMGWIPRQQWRGHELDPEATVAWAWAGSRGNIRASMLTHHLTPSHTISHHLTPSHAISHHLTPSHTISHHRTPSHTISHVTRVPSLQAQAGLAHASAWAEAQAQMAGEEQGGGCRMRA